MARPRKVKATIYLTVEAAAALKRLLRRYPNRKSDIVSGAVIYTEQMSKGFLDANFQPASALAKASTRERRH